MDAAMKNFPRFSNVIAAWLLAITCGCSFAPKRDLTQLHLGNSRAHIQGVLGKPAASYRHQDHDVDVYAFFQGYSQAQQVLMSSGKVLVTVAGATLVMVIDGIIEEELNGFDEDPPSDKSQMAAYESRKRAHEEEQTKRREEQRVQREAEAQQWQEEQWKATLVLAEDGLAPEDFNPKLRTDVRGKTLHFDNHVYADGSRHLVFAVNYDADQKLSSVAFLAGLTKASGDAFGRGPETWFKKRGKFPLQDVRQSIFFAPPEEVEQRIGVISLPALE
jgi:hypothetical protein